MVPGKEASLSAHSGLPEWVPSVKGLVLPSVLSKGHARPQRLGGSPSRHPRRKEGPTPTPLPRLPDLGLPERDLGVSVRPQSQVSTSPTSPLSLPGFPRPSGSSPGSRVGRRSVPVLDSLLSRRPHWEPPVSRGPASLLAPSPHWVPLGVSRLPVVLPLCLRSPPTPQGPLLTFLGVSPTPAAPTLCPQVLRVTFDGGADIDVPRDTLGPRPTSRRSSDGLRTVGSSSPEWGWGGASSSETPDDPRLRRP